MRGLETADTVIKANTCIASGLDYALQELCHFSKMIVLYKLDNNNFVYRTLFYYFTILMLATILFATLCHKISKKYHVQGV